MPKYLYLSKPEWTTAWVLGGTVPIALASTYKSHIREGILTPDENLIHRSTVDIASLSASGYHFENVKGLTFEGNSYNGELLPNTVDADYYVDDGLILSFSNRKSNSLCTRLGKAACVVIEDIEGLKVCLDQQIGTKGIAGNCAYTADHQRNHFLKSIEDEWQQEYRMFWPATASRKVNIPSETARRIKVR